MPVIARSLPPVAALVLVFAVASGCAPAAETPAPVPTDSGTASPSAEPTDGATDAPVDGEEVEAIPLPDDFPEEIPTPEAEVLETHTLVEGWTLWFAAPDPVAGFDAAAALLVEAGFVEEVRSAGASSAYGVYSTEAYVVELTAGTGATHGSALAMLVKLVPVTEDDEAGEG